MINTEAIKVINHTPTPLWKMFGILDYLGIILLTIIIVTFILIIVEVIDIEKLLPKYNPKTTLIALFITVPTLTALIIVYGLQPKLRNYVEEKNTLTIQAELDAKNPKLKDLKTLYENQEKYKEQLKSKTEMYLDYNKNKPVAKITTTRTKLKSICFMYPTLSNYLDKEVENLVDLLENPEKIK